MPEPIIPNPAPEGDPEPETIDPRDVPGLEPDTDPEPSPLEAPEAPDAPPDMEPEEPIDTGDYPAPPAGDDVQGDASARPPDYEPQGDHE